MGNLTQPFLVNLIWISIKYFLCLNVEPRLFHICPHLCLIYLCWATLLAITSGPCSWTLCQHPQESDSLLHYSKPLVVDSTNMITSRNRQVRKLHLWTLATIPAGQSATFATMNNLSLLCDPIPLSIDSKCWSGASEWLRLVPMTESEL